MVLFFAAATSLKCNQSIKLMLSSVFTPISVLQWAPIISCNP